MTGMGGSGKTTTLNELSKFGHLICDLDDTDVCFWVNKISGEKVEYQASAGSEWLHNHSWRLSVKELQDLLDSFPLEKDVFVGGKIARSQLKEVSLFFDRVFLLSPSNKVLSYRQSTRKKDNQFGKLKEEQEKIAQDRKDFEVACIDVGAVKINADLAIDKVVEIILKLRKIKKTY
jgi:predicted ATPase